MVTIDASVLVAAAAPDDPARAESMAFLAAVLGGGHPIHQPTLTLVEVAAAVGRRTQDVDLAREAGLRLLEMPGLVLDALDLDAAADAALLASAARLRGADAIYAATARRQGSTLVTLDAELLDRTQEFVSTMTPSAWLRRHDPQGAFPNRDS